MRNWDEGADSTLLCMLGTVGNVGSTLKCKWLSSRHDHLGSQDSLRAHIEIVKTLFCCWECVHHVSILFALLCWSGFSLQGACRPLHSVEMSRPPLEQRFRQTQCIWKLSWDENKRTQWVSCCTVGDRGPVIGLWVAGRAWRLPSAGIQLCRVTASLLPAFGGWNECSLEMASEIITSIWGYGTWNYISHERRGHAVRSSHWAIHFTLSLVYRLLIPVSSCFFLVTPYVSGERRFRFSSCDQQTRNWQPLHQTQKTTVAKFKLWTLTT